MKRLLNLHLWILTKCACNQYQIYQEIYIFRSKVSQDGCLQVRVRVVSQEAERCDEIPAEDQVLAVPPVEQGKDISTSLACDVQLMSRSVALCGVIYIIT